MDVIGEVLYWALRLAAVWFGIKGLVLGVKYLREKWEETGE